MTDLIKKREVLIAEHQAMEKYDPHWIAEAKAGRKISEQPIAFQCDDEVCVVGGCVGKVLSGMKKFMDECDVRNKETAQKEDPNTKASDGIWAERKKKEPMVAQCFAKIEKLLKENPKEIRVTTQVWNSISSALDEIGMHVCLTDGNS